MIDKRFAEMFMNEKYAKLVEYAFKKLYVGKGNIAFILEHILNIFERVMDKGYLSFNTFKIFEDLKKTYSGESVIISRDSEEITVLNKETDTVDTFYLYDFVFFFVTKVSRDPLFRKEMRGHYDYAGMMNALKKLSNADGATGRRYSFAVNAVTYGSHLYVIDKKDERLRLLKIKKQVGSPLDGTKKLMELSTPDIFQDRANGWVYVNHADGNGRRINMYTGEIQPVKGRIIGLSNEGEIIVCRNDQLLICNDQNRILTRIGNASDVLLNTHETEGVSWMSVVNDKLSFTWCCRHRFSEAHSLKADFVWKYFLDHAYVFEEDTDNKISIVLWKHNICETPVPFTAKVIQERIRVIEQRLQDGMVRKAGSYINMLLPILMEKDLSKDLTDELFCTYGINILDFKELKSSTDEYNYNLPEQNPHAEMPETEENSENENDNIEYFGLDSETIKRIAQIKARIKALKAEEEGV